MAAGILFVTEAGGMVTTIDVDGDPKTGVQILAATPNCIRNCGRCCGGKPTHKPCIPAKAGTQV